MAKTTKFSNELMVLRAGGENPKKPNSKSRVRFDKYPRNMATVGDILKIEGGPNRGDLAWDKKHGYIFIGTKEELSSLSKK